MKGIAIWHSCNLNDRKSKYELFFFFFLKSEPFGKFSYHKCILVCLDIKKIRSFLIGVIPGLLCSDKYNVFVAI